MITKMQCILISMEHHRSLVQFYKAKINFKRQLMACQLIRKSKEWAVQHQILHNLLKILRV